MTDAEFKAEAAADLAHELREKADHAKRVANALSLLEEDAIRENKFKKHMAVIYAERELKYKYELERARRNF